jgi:hypothetical protein
MKYVRFALTLALLATVWFHAHWSVALCLTLNVVGLELMVALYNPQAGRRDTH